MHGFVVPEKVPWTELNQRYFAFAASLPPPLDKLALDRCLFLGKGISVEFQSLAEFHPLITCLPWLFDDAFPAISQADVVDIGEAGVYLLMGGALHDAYEDGQFDDQPDIRLLHGTLTNIGREKLDLLFEPDSSFWSFYDRYVYEYQCARLLEKEHVGQIKPYFLDEMFRIGSGKVALFKIVTTAVAFKGQGEKYASQLERAVDLMAAALQLGDDIEDWAEDYPRKNYTLPLTYVIPTESWPTSGLSVEEVGRRFDSSVILEKLIIQVIEWFQHSLDVVGELNCPHWVAFVESCLTLTRNYQESIIAKKLLKIIRFRSLPLRTSR